MEMTRARLEGLLDAFPKLVGSEKSKFAMLSLTELSANFFTSMSEEKHRFPRKKEQIQPFLRASSTS